MSKESVVSSPPSHAVLVTLTLSGLLAGMTGGTVAQHRSRFTPFGTVTVAPSFVLNGAGQNVDSIAFWEAPDPRNTLMFVTAKASQLVEVWQYPFKGNEQTSLRHSSFGSDTQVNGVVMDQNADLLYVTVSAPVSTVSTFSFPDGVFVHEFITGDKKLRSEPNIDLYHFSDGTTYAYVTADKIVHIYDAETGEFISDFEPSTDVETVLADEFYEVIYLPDENSRGGIFAFNPDGTPYERNGKQSFGSENIFQSDAEGVLLYTFPTNGNGDDGSGFIVVSDQRRALTDFEFFDRETWEYLGTVQIEDVSNTDGIASIQKALPDYPQGLFVAIDNDAAAVGVDWRVIFEATGLVDCDRAGNCPGECVIFDFEVVGGAWYLISLPVIPEDNSLATLFPDALAAFCWDFASQGYLRATNIEPQRAYWLLMLNTASREICGPRLETYESQYAVQGWDMIGSVPGETQPVTMNPANSILAMFGWDAATESYATLSSPFAVDERKGYWALVFDVPTTVTIGAASPSVTLSKSGGQEKLRASASAGSLPPGPPVLALTADDDRELIPKNFALVQNYPNPFNPETRINYQLPEVVEVQLSVYNLRGQEIRRLVNARQAAGFHSVTWNGRDSAGKRVTSGVYIYRLEAGEFVDAKKLTLLR